MTAINHEYIADLILVYISVFSCKQEIMQWFHLELPSNEHNWAFTHWQANPINDWV